MKIAEEVIGIVIAFTALVGFFNYYKRKLLIKRLEQKSDIDSQNKVYDFVLYFKMKDTETPEEKVLRQQVNISLFIILTGFVVLSILVLL